MRHVVWFDEQAGVLRLELHGTFSREDAPEFFPLVKKYFEGREERYLICDLSHGGSEIPSDREYRRWLREKYDEIGFDRIAMVNARPAMRMLAKIVLAAAGAKKQVRFFLTSEEAEQWILHQSSTNEVG